MTTQTQQLYEAAKAVANPNFSIDQIYRNLDKLQEAITAYEQSTEHQAAYEFHNLTTGHCYVDYVPRIDMDEKDGYTKIPLYK